jgi:type IV pilus assembly protein PilB
MSASLMVADTDLRKLFVDELELVTSSEFDTCTRLSKRLRVPLEQAIAEQGRLPLGFVLEQIAGSWGVRYTDLKIGDIDHASLRRIPEKTAASCVAVAFAESKEGLSVAMADPRDHKAISDLRRTSGQKIVPYLADPSAIQRAQLLYRTDVQAMLRHTGTDAVAATGDEPSVSVLLTRILEFAALSGASDIHIEPYAGELLVRCRIDGVLRDVLTRPPALATPLAARIKVLSGMRIDERRSPQDGRFGYDEGGLSLDLRVSSLPTQLGEKIVMRVIPKAGLAFDLETLGLRPDDFERVSRALDAPFGMVLVTGPTGSGKSTTLYSMITRLTAARQSLVNISTIEDPVEHPLPRVAQVAVNPAAGIDFASGLRALLRQDPDVIMVGEIRDKDTAEVATRAALVGRMLISTLHTNDTVSTVPRLLDMGIEPYLLSSTLSMVVAQRLLRRICMGCRESVTIDEAMLTRLRNRPDWPRVLDALRSRGILGGAEDNLAGMRMYKGKGCARCGGSGFRGRTGIFEILELNDEMRRMILTRPDASTLAEAAARAGMRSMFEDGLAKIFLGETTLDELFRVAM